MSNITQNINIEHAKLVFRNFTGKAGTFNAKGKRNFGVLLDTPVAEALERDGWNIKWLKPRDPLDAEQAFLKINVNFDGANPPKIVLVGSENKSQVNELNVTILDWADIDYVDLTASPYNYNVQGKQGVTAYLKLMYVVLAEDDFESKYINVPDSAQNIKEEDAD